MTKLTARELELLHESNAIEDIVNIDYRVVAGDAGHVAAYLDARARAMAQQRLAVEDLCRWQRWITEEQRAFGHPMPPGGAGVLRGPSYPHDVMVGGHVAAPYAQVPELVALFVDDVNARIDAVGSFPEDADLAALLGDLFQRFQAIHPFVDGNGRTGRLLLAYLALRLNLPVIVVRVADRSTFYPAHRSKLAMRVFMADKMREAIDWPGRGVLERQSFDTYADVYDGLVVERHALVAQQQAWRAAAEAKQRG